jgi:hypothetical protein
MVFFGGPWTGTDLTARPGAISLKGAFGWSRLAPAGVPPIDRDQAIVAFDEEHRRAFILGGYPVSEIRELRDFWILSLDESSTLDAPADPPATAPRFGLDSPRPNPAHGRVTLSFAVEGTSDGGIEVFDVAGRRLWSESWKAGRPGSRTTELREAARWAPGVYLVRLREGGRTATQRIAIVR